MTGTHTDYVRVKLDLFEGPLDLLLHLIRGNQIDISAVNISEITDQYLNTLELMKELDLDIAGEYLVMAATLILIKSRMLLPPPDGITDEDVEDPREELIRRLKEYEQFKRAGDRLGQCESNRLKLHSRPIPDPEQKPDTEWIIDASIVDLLSALKDIMNRRKTVHIVKTAPVSVRFKMTVILDRLGRDGPVMFSEFFDAVSSKQEMIAVFLAILELVRIQAVRARQKTLSGDIRLVLNRPSRG